MPTSPRSTRWSITEAGELQALDAKIVLDDSALFRHPDLEAMRDLDEEEPSEIAARERASTSSSSTAASAAWSTAPGWR